MAEIPYQLPGVVTPFTPEKAFPPPGGGAGETPSKPIPQPVAQDYADAMTAGMTLGPQDYHDAYHAAGHEPLPDMAKDLPSQAQLIDTAIDALYRSNLPPSAEMVDTTKQNLIDHWAATGMHPTQTVNDPVLRDQMTRQPASTSTLGSLVQHLETGDQPPTGSPSTIMQSLVGARQSDASVVSFLRRGGSDFNPNEGNWCAAFTNSALAQAGVKGTGSNVATSFLDWGSAVLPDNVSTNDVVVIPRGHAAGQVGGHVGLATGETRQGKDGLEIEMVSGNRSGSRDVGVDWVPASQVQIRRGSGPDTAVSSAGAVGRNQVMPETAKEYGFDPAKLTDPAYNNMVRDHILDDLSQRYHGETAAILIGYNAGPGVADKWIASGRDNSVLPEETKGYLARAARGGGNMMAAAPTTYNPEAPVSFTEKVQHAAADFAGVFKSAAEKAEANLSTPEAQESLKGLGMNMLFSGGTGPEGGAQRETAETVAPLLVGALAATGLRAMFSTPEQLAAHALSDKAGEFAQTTIRGATGQERRFIAGASAALESFRATVNKGLPEYQAWLAQHPGVGVPMWSSDTPAVARLIDHIEGGFGGGKLPADHPLRPVADAIRELYENVRAAIEAVPEFDGMGFVEDYYRHLWTQPTAADRAFSTVGRTGSSASLNRRSIPTIMEGIAKGLTPRILDPIENTLHYVAGMRNYLAAREVFQAGRDAGYIKYSLDAPDVGWVRLKGRSSEISGLPGSPPMRAWAPQGYASAYNSYVGRGFYDWGPKTSKIFENLTRASVLTTAMKLSLSGYHYLVISAESVAAGFANAFGELAHGELARGFRDMGMAVTILPHLASAGARGSQVAKAYLTHQGSDLDLKLANIIANAGGRVVGRGAEYGYTQAANWFTAFRRGSLAQELKMGAAHTLGDANEPIAKRVALMGPRMGAFFGHELGRAMQTLTAPLFDKIIPTLKTAAIADEISSFLRQNPLADEAAILAHARRIVDSMDDRFGEMIQDNLFWPRTLKQALNLATVSVGWEYGTLRGATGAVSDLLHGNALSTRARWLLAFPITMGLFASVYQYLKTGIAGPSAQTPGRDMVAPRTGGKTPEGAPERALLPGQQKDFLQWFRMMQDAPDLFAVPSVLEGYAQNKLNPFAQILLGTFRGTDWYDNPVWQAPPDPRTLEAPPGWESYARFVLNEIAPITTEGPPVLRGTNITTPERFMGLRPAPEWIQNPARVGLAEQRRAAYLRRQQILQMRRQQRRLAQPNE